MPDSTSAEAPAQPLEQPFLRLVIGERVSNAISRNLAQLDLVESAKPSDPTILTRQVDAEKGRVVRTERDRNPLIEEAAQRVSSLDDAGAVIAGECEVEWNLRRAEAREHGGIVKSSKTVRDPPHT